MLFTFWQYFFFINFGDQNFEDFFRISEKMRKMKNTKFNQKQGDGKIEKMCDYQQKIFKNIYLKN